MCSQDWAHILGLQRIVFTVKETQVLESEQTAGALRMFTKLVRPQVGDCSRLTRICARHRSVSRTTRSAVRLLVRENDVQPQPPTTLSLTVLREQSFLRGRCGRTSYLSSSYSVTTVHCMVSCYWPIIGCLSILARSVLE